MIIGAHAGNGDLPAEVAARDADLIQVFLSNPQSWKKPIPRDDAEALAAWDVPIYVHAPYLVNVGSPNNRVRIPSRKILADTLEAAGAIGASGVVVHGGHIGDDEDMEVGFDRWRKALEAVDITVPVLIENTAGGGNAILRECDNYGPLWEHIGHHDVGVVIDTCHAWASGEDLTTVVERVTAAVGNVDLVHCNDSRDESGSNRDRHANLGAGHVPGEQLVHVVKTAGAPVVVETPGGAEEHTTDITWLRERL